ncbi:ABC transporter substrate-binding protein [Eubacterium multiforme]|uniref:Peptide/nickel transport system substrate-binding protein n=1 Tax=Eubacterium multiforme TaxID=83339 RepID=A0ABT9UWI0_9FIRM|nr:ABC transporter substrate-binding protein [Eubacterium multiforme]MDQ0150664.1 peptide/nickel transport system substrate-binding protein [Eubacterium multiforme]
MKKLIIPSFIISIIILLSFIEIEKIDEVNGNESLLYAVNTMPNELKDVSKLTVGEEDIICATSRGLMEKDSNGKLVPSLATEVKIKDDGVEYEFKIVDDAYWSDGSRITAKDIENFFKELLKEEKDENIIPFLNVYGAKEFRNGKTTFEQGVAINSEEDKLTIRLNKKDDKFLDELTKTQYRIRKYLLMWNDIERNYKTIVYSGEYFISKVSSDGIELKKNSKSKSDSTENIKIISDENEELSMAAFEIGERDIVINPPSTELNRLQSEGRLKTLPSEKGKYISLNSESENLPLSVRKTLYFNINSAMIEYEEQNLNYIELAESSYFRDDKDNLDKLQSRKVMTNNMDGKLPEIITILAKDTNENRGIVKQLQNWFNKNTNTNIRYTLATETEFKNLELRKRYDILIIDETSNSNNKKEFYLNLKSYYTENELKIYEKLYKKENKNFNELEETLFNNYTILPLLFENKAVAISKEVNNIEFDWYGNIKFQILK